MPDMRFDICSSSFSSGFYLVRTTDTMHTHRVCVYVPFAVTHRNVNICEKYFW